MQSADRRMKIYLDNCCYNRPFDDQTQDRIYLESEIILMILRRGENGWYRIIGSDILDLEIENMKNDVKKQRVKKLYEMADIHIQYTSEIRQSAKNIMSISNIKNFDSLHIASAEYAGADIMLTTDDKLEKMAAKLELHVKVMNPMKFAMEVL